MKHHSIPTRMPIMKQYAVMRTWVVKLNPHLSLVGMQMARRSRKLLVPQKVKHKRYHMPQQFHCYGYAPKIWIHVHTKLVYNILSSIHNSQKVETWMPNSSMDKIRFTRQVEEWNTCTNSENMLSESSQSQDCILRFHLDGMSLIGQCGTTLLLN